MTLTVPRTELDLILSALDDPSFVEALTDDELDSILWALQEASYAPGTLHLQPHQLPPPGDDWFGWLFSAGRGAGKTDAVCKDFYAHAMGPPCDPMLPGGHRLGIVGPTLGDVATSCYEGPSGLLRLDDRIRMVTRRGGTFVVFPNGSLAKCVGGDNAAEAKRLRAHGNTCRVWVEEAAAIRALGVVWNQVLLSCRHGHRPRVTLSSTPANTLAYKRIMRHPRVVVTRARMEDNVFLNDEFKTRMRETFAGTTTEAMELDGELVEETPGAHWTQDSIDRRRINVAELQAAAPAEVGEPVELWLRRVLKLTTVVVGLDPATSGRGDRTGIVVAGANPPDQTTGRRQAFILEDRTGLMVPSLVDLGDADGDDLLPDDIEGWAEVVAQVARRWQANAVVVEKNRLGRTARAVLRSAGLDGRIVERNATDSKWNRADPVRSAWPRQCFIVGAHPTLETDMTSWVPALGDDPTDSDDLDTSDEFAGSPDALDAMVHAVRYLLQIDAPRRKKAGSGVGAALEAGWNRG